MSKWVFWRIVVKTKYFLKHSSVILKQAKLVFGSDQVVSAFFCEEMNYKDEQELENNPYIQEQTINLLNSTEVLQGCENWYITLDNQTNPAVVIEFTSGRKILFSTNSFAQIACIDNEEKIVV